MQLSEGTHCRGVLSRLPISIVGALVLSAVAGSAIWILQKRLAPRYR